MSSRVELFKPEHLDQMDLRPQERKRLEKQNNLQAQLAALAYYGTGGTLFVDDTSVGSFGYLELWPGCLEVWAFPSIHVQRYAMVYLRTVKRYIQAIGKTHNPRRIQTTSVDDELHNRWMAYLGFTNETPNGMKNYSSLGETFNTWSITYEVPVE